MGSDFWRGMVDWVRQVMLEREENIDEEDMDRFLVTDDVDEAARLIKDCYEGKRTFGPPPEKFPAEAVRFTAEGTRMVVQPWKFSEQLPPPDDHPEQ
jgi:hypothetical protein